MRGRRIAVRNLIGWLAFLAAIVVSQAPSADLVAASETWRFDVFLNDREIGFHEFQVSAENDVQKVSVEAAFDLKHWLLPNYRYRHKNDETWNGECLLSIDATTETNGQSKAVNLDHVGLAATPATDESRCVMSFAYWNPALVDASELLDPQTGVIRPLRVEPRGEEFVPFNGRHLRALRYDLFVDDGQRITVWYEAGTDRWVRLEAPTRGKRVLRYEPTRLPRRESSADA